MKIITLNLLLLCFNLLSYNCVNANYSDLPETPFKKTLYKSTLAFEKPKMFESSKVMAPNFQNTQRNELFSISLFGNASLYANGFGIMRGPALDFNLHIDEENIIHIGCNYYIQSTHTYTIKLDHKDNTITELKYDAKAESVQSGFEFNLGVKSFYINSSDEKFGMYYLCDISVAYFKHKINVSNWDTLNFVNPYQNLSKRIVGFYGFVGTGVNLNYGDIKIFSECKLLIPLNFEDNPPGLNLCAGFRFPIIYD